MFARACLPNMFFSIAVRGERGPVGGEFFGLLGVVGVVEHGGEMSCTPPHFAEGANSRLLLLRLLAIRAWSVVLLG